MGSYIKEAIKELEEISSINEIQHLFKKFDVEKFKMKELTYPPIQFKIEKKEIEELINKEVIKDGKIVADNFENNALIKLLYAVLWKNGDLPKIKHIVEGILDESDNVRENGIVFHQFGKYLTKKNDEPIIDQHVLRAFGIYKAKSQNEIEKLKKMSVITKNHTDLVKDYKIWLNESLKSELRSQENYTYEIDQLLFALGKSVKNK